MSPISTATDPLETVDKSVTKSESAKSKWKVLASAISRKDKSKNCKNNSEVLLRFPSYQVIHAEPIQDDDKSLLWFNVTLPEFSHVNLKICIVPPSNFSLDDLTGFNNTGNLCIWPAEECLTQYCLENVEIFSGKSVIELGGGMTSFAGLAVAALGKPSEVLLTDGNVTSCENLKTICQSNPNLSLKSMKLRWDEVDENLRGKFEIAICSDCLFFDEGRPQLIKCLKEVLEDGGVAVIVAPSRHGTFQKFIELIRLDGSFSFEQSDNYSDKISKIRQELSFDSRFDENLQYPNLLKLKKLS